MSDYSETVTKLRDVYRAYVVTGNDKAGQFLADAAAAIEDLEDTVQAKDKALKECARQLSEMQEDLDYANAANTELYGVFQENEKLKATIELMKPYMPDFFPDANKMVFPKHDRILSRPHWVSVFNDLPRHNAVVVVSDGKRSWDVGQYHFLFKADDRTIWWWKNHTTRKVLWWMYKEDAIPEPPQEVQE